MSSKDEKRHSEEKKPTPSHPPSGRARQRRSEYPGLNCICNPLSVPGADRESAEKPSGVGHPPPPQPGGLLVSPAPGGFRNGHLYFPWSLVPRKYLDFPLPRPPLPITPHQRPTFWHHSEHGESARTEGTQDDLQQLWPGRTPQSSRESRAVLCNPQGGRDPSPEPTSEEEAGKKGRCPRGHMPSAAPPAQSNKVDRAVQCDMSWPQCAEPGSPAASSAEGREGTEEEWVLCGAPGGQEAGEQDSGPSAAQSAQSDQIDEEIPCDMVWVDLAELEDCPEQRPPGGGESPDRPTGSRKLGEASVAFLKGKKDIASAKEISSDEWELDDEAVRIEWLLEDEVGGPSSKEKVGREESWGSYFYSLLFRPSSSDVRTRKAEGGGSSGGALSSQKRTVKK